MSLDEVLRQEHPLYSSNLRCQDDAKLPDAEQTNHSIKIVKNSARWSLGGYRVETYVNSHQKLRSIRRGYGRDESRTSTCYGEPAGLSFARHVLAADIGLFSFSYKPATSTLPYTLTASLEHATLSRALVSAKAFGPNDIIRSGCLCKRRDSLRHSWSTRFTFDHRGRWFRRYDIFGWMGT